MSLTNNLNSEQLKAINHGDGPLLIVAGAGTGKTTVITERVVWLTSHKNVEADRILALTFTDKAANEMQERIDRALPYGYLDLWVSTFHAFCQRILEAHAIDIGLPYNFKLLNQTQQWLLVHQNLDRFNLNYYRPLGNPAKFIHALLRLFSRAKDEILSPADFLNYAQNLKLNTDSLNFLSQALSPEEQKSLTAGELKELAAQEITKINEVADAYHVYQQLLLENNAMDFGDLINYCLKLFLDRPRILATYRHKFRYILVDEFQDTNWAQYQLIKILASPKENLTVVGDDDQSIYKFRGASVSNILKFKEDYPQAVEIFLTKNYRSCQNILDLAYDFIQLNNPERLEIKLAKDGKLSKRLIAQKTEPAVIKLMQSDTEEDEVSTVINKILEIKNINEELSWSDFAILVRANDHAEAFNAGFARANIPYQFVASRGLYNKPIIIDILAYLKLLDNYHEGPAMYRILTMPIFDFTQNEIINLNYWAKRKSISLFQALAQASSFGGISGEVIKKITKVLGLVEKHTRLVGAKGVREIVLAFLEDSGYLEYLTKADSLENQQTLSYLNQFYKKIVNFEDNSGFSNVKSFLEMMDLELKSGEQGSLLTDPEEGPESVKVMTIHAAKGLEFEHVFIVNLVDRRFPTINRSDPIEIPNDLIKEILPTGDIHLQEERRLFYVACTRAKQGLWFTGARDYGGHQLKKPSRFLYEIKLVKEEKPIKTKKSKLDKIERELHEKKETPTAVSVPKTKSPPQRFSFSQLKAYESCPWQYRFSFVLKVPVTGKPQFSFGKTIHSVMLRLMETVISRQASIQSGLFDGMEKKSKPKTLKETVSIEEIIKLYNDLWIDDWYESAGQREAYFKNGQEILKSYYRINQDVILKPLYLEKGFNIKINNNSDASHTLYGVIDRIDELDGGIEIIDYKTGAAKEKLAAEDKEQLLIYQMAVSEIFKQKVELLSFHYFEKNTKQSFLGTAKDLLRLKEKIINVISEIEKGQFKPKPGLICKSCDYREICEHRTM